jgi:heat shock protein 5
VYALKNQMGDQEKLGGKLTADEKKTIEEAVEEAVSWLDSNKQADTQELQAQKKQIEAKVHPIVTKLYQNAGGAGGEHDGDDDSRDEL